MMLVISASTFTLVELLATIFIKNTLIKATLFKELKLLFPLNKVGTLVH